MSKYQPSALVGQTLAFLVLGWTSILHIFTVRSRKSIFKRTLRDNPLLVVSAAAMILSLVVLVAVPYLGPVFGLTTLEAPHWISAIVLSVIPTMTAEARKLVDNRAAEKVIRYSV